MLTEARRRRLYHHQEFLRPIVTPFELEMALTNKSWTGDYVLDFTELLTQSSFGQDHVDLSRDDVDDEGPVYSATTGKYRHPKRYTKGGVDGESCQREIQLQVVALGGCF